jgi:hypothetical protein
MQTRRPIVKAVALPLPTRTPPLALLGVMVLALSSAVIMSQVVALVVRL